MPELPEVENIKIGLEPSVINKKIIDVTFSSIIEESHKNGKLALVKNELSFFKENLVGKTILKLDRRGKYIYFTLDNGYLITHFGMTGAYFVVRDIGEITNHNYYKHRHIIFEFENGEKMVFSDIRRFGELRYVQDVATFKPFVNLAPEPFDKNSLEHFLTKLDSKKYREQPIKALLLEGNVFCGCGNIYACEVLYKEKIHPATLAKDLTIEEKTKLFNTTVNILKFSIEQGGSTISDYVHTDGGEGNMQNFLEIYGKKECPQGHKTENLTIKTRSSHFCPTCQTKKYNS